MLNNPVACDVEIEGKRGQGGPKRHGTHLQRETVVSGNSTRLTLLIENVRSAIHAASQLPGG